MKKVSDKMKKNTALANFRNNKIFFYCVEIDQQKKELLESFDVIVELYPLDKNAPAPYDGHYKNILTKIRERCSDR